LQIKTKIIRCHTADSKPVKQEVNGTVILPPLISPALRNNQISLQMTALKKLNTTFFGSIITFHRPNLSALGSKLNFC
jgi:hypothetical protein